jgi:hypothetical protein
VHNSASPTAIRKNIIEGLFKSPSPAETPRTIHARCGGQRSRCSRISASRQVIQNIDSKEFIERKLSRPRYCGAHNTHSIARPCAGRRPPSAQASRPVRKTRAAPASAENMRIPVRECPNKSSASLA